MGTIHINDKDVMEMADRAKPLIATCHKYVGEMNLGLVDPESAKEAMLNKYSDFLPRTYLSVKKYQKIEDVVKKYFQINFSELHDYYPMMIQNQLLKSKLDNNHPHSLDHELYTIALSLNKEIDGLETPEEQFLIMGKIDIDEQWRQFLKFVQYPKKYIDKMKALKQYYIDDQSHLIYKSVYMSLGKFRKVMLFDRNVIMAARLSRILQSSTAFVSVGAAHLYGNKGLIAILKKKDYRITKL
jgi:hypothetical protein